MIYYELGKTDFHAASLYRRRYAYRNESDEALSISAARREPLFSTHFRFIHCFS